MHIPCYGIFALVIRLKHFWLSRSFPESYQCWENCLIERSLELQIAQKKTLKFRVDMSWWWTLIRIIVALFVDCIGWTYPFSSSLRFKILSFFLQIQLSDCVIENNQQTIFFFFLKLKFQGYSLKIKSTNRFYCIIHAHDWIWWVN